MKLSSKTITLLGLYLSLSFNVIASDDSEADGQFLHADKCLKCHTDQPYINQKSGIENYQKLHSRVKMCSHQAEAEFFDDEIISVTDYLNNTYYKFKK
ncbi:MAG: hypothetical protein DRQ51_00190 [Gammaproteobacteria bacterium]|nr:MAG: hypothetical protein DRQ51_00190 [Gammaproteobacteria bacterium]